MCMDPRLKYTVRAQRYKHNPFSFGGTDWSRILIPTEYSVGSSNAMAYGNEMKNTSSTNIVTLTSSFILPITFDKEMIDGNVFCNLKVGMEARFDGMIGYISDVDVEIKKMFSDGSTESLSGVVALLDGGTTSGPIAGNYNVNLITGQVFGWVPVHDKVIESNEHIVITTTVISNTTLSGYHTDTYLFYAADSDDTYFIIPFV